MTTALSFRHEVICKKGLSAYAVYVSEATVNAPYALHLEMDGSKKSSPCNFSVAQKSGGEEYQTVYTSTYNRIQSHGCIFDHDFGGEAWPKQVRIVSPAPVLSASITTNSIPSGNIDAAELIAQIKELQGDDDSNAAATPEIDSHKEIKDFLEGYDNTKKLREVVSGTVDADGIVHY